MKTTEQKSGFINLLSETKEKKRKKKVSKFIGVAEDGFDYLLSFHLSSFTGGFHPSFQTKSPLGEGGTSQLMPLLLEGSLPSPVQPRQQTVLNCPSTSPALDRHLPTKARWLSLPTIPVRREKHSRQMVEGERKHYRPNQLPFLTGVLVQTII